jgi:hypothetical protein
VLAITRMSMGGQRPLGACGEAACVLDGRSPSGRTHAVHAGIHHPRPNAKDLSINQQVNCLFTAKCGVAGNRVPAISPAAIG